MKSQEFIPEQVLDEYSYTDPDIKRILTDPNRPGGAYKFLPNGEGVDQSAYLEPGTNLVLKIFGTQKDSDTFSEDHMMFFKWAKFCDKHKDNEFLPKFYGYDSFIFKGNRYLQIRQEFLFKLDYGTGDLLAAMADDIEEDGKFETFIKLIPVEYDSNIQQAYEGLVKLIGPAGVDKLYKTIKKLNKIGNNHDWHLDLHSDNFMKRDDGTPVIVDPWVVPKF